MPEDVIYLNQLAFEVFEFMRSPEGQTAEVSMPMLSMKMDVPESRLHGRQHFISIAIEQLRRLKLVEDVPDRCWACNRPPRLRRVVVLHLTAIGKSANVALRTAGCVNRKAKPFEEITVEDRIDDARQEFWQNLGRIVALALNKVPKDHHDDLLMRLQDSCSVYGVDYSKHLQEQP